MPNSPLSRRMVMAGAALVTTGLSFGAGARQFGKQAQAQIPQASLPLITKPIASTGEQLPVIGLGTNNYSVDTPEELAELQQVLETMAKQGGKVIDTARVYGRAEEVIGDLLQRTGKREDFFLATKTPMRGATGSAEEELRISAQRLKVDRIDLVLVHNLGTIETYMPALIEAKKAGRIRYIGLSTSSEAQYTAVIEAIKRYPLDFIQIDYSIANRTPEERVLPAAQERGVAVMANRPFGGRNAEDNIFSKLKGPLPEFAANFDATSWGQVMLKYIVSHPAMTVAIPGTTKVRHLLDNQGAGRGRLPTPEDRLKIERLWDAL